VGIYGDEETESCVSKTVRAEIIQKWWKALLLGLFNCYKPLSRQRTGS